jgi:lipopolysaccharide biosynthesis glycosyltransferase
MSQRRTICTIIAKNYLAFARTLAQSFLAQHPGGKVYVLVVDDFAGLINPANECFEIVTLAALNIPNLPEFCFKYNLKELCTAAKASLLEYLLRERSVERLIYLDPDVLVTGSLDELYEKLGAHDIVLTPHLDRDYPDDDLLPNEGHILRAGQFNLGFIGVNSSEHAKSFLKWWRSKLYEKCVVDVANGYFVDQKFIDFVPLFFERVWIEKDAGYNVAYWNLHSRQLSDVSGAWKCNDGPLHFFHFSGYDPEGSGISIHVTESLARNRFANRRDLTKLFTLYKNLLLENGHRETSSWLYSFDYFNTGERVPEHVRSYYRSLPKSRRHKNPFESEELKQLARLDSRLAEGSELTAAEQLNAIMNSRAWRWVSRYGRFKNRYLTPAAELFGRRFGTRRTK